MSDGFATMGAAVIGAAIAVVGLVISKENKISEFRQQWIDGLRADVSSFIAAASGMQTQPISAESYRDFLFRLQEFRCRVELRFKKGDPDAREIRECLKKVFVSAENMQFSLETHREMTRLTEVTQDLLKFEWERVKAGETGYLLTLKIGKFVMLGLIAIFAGWVLLNFVLIPLIGWLPSLFKG